MPSACLKTEKKAPMEAEDAMKQCIIVVDKKVRNLEKRKGKLEGYREKSRQGDELNSDQKEAISSYDAVLRNLEFARELQKQFSEIQEKAEKLLKKRAKFEKQDRHNEEVARIQELLRVQSLLDNMGAEDVREDFKTGNKGAVTLSEESLNQLDELYKLISPSRDGEQSYTSQLTQAADHIVNFLDAKDKEVAGTTYKNLKDLIRQINECGYFEKTNVEEDQTTTEQAKETESTTEVTEAPLKETPKVEDDSTVVSDAAMATAPEQASSRISPVQSQPQAAEAQPTPPPQTQIHTESLPNTLQPNPATHHVYEREDQVQAESLFTGGQMARPRAFQEIVSSVQGSFDFLQDSEIDTQQKAKKAQEVLHADPAVVVASRTLTGSSLHTNTSTDPLSQSFGSSAAPKNLLEDQQPTQYQQSTKNQSVSENSLSQSQGFADVLSAAPSQPQSAQFGQSSTFEPDIDSKWSQGIYLPTSTTTESIDRSWGEQASGSAVAAPSQSWGEQTASQTPSWSTGQQGPSAAATVDSQVSDLPAPIPMPPSQQQPAAPSSHAAAPPPAFSTGNQDNVPSFSQVTSNNQETKSSLNPNADIWYSSQPTNFSQDSANEFDSSNQMSSKHDHYGNSDMGGGYQSQGYRGRRDYDSRGGPRGGRGGPRGGVTNGYGGGRGGSRGGSSYRGDDRRGGPRGGNRGGPSMQGYQPRSNYQSDGGYQGSSNSSNTYGYSSHDSGAGFTNKSWGGQRGGGMRGGNRGGSGPRGGSRGNYSRPTSATNQ